MNAPQTSPVARPTDAHGRGGLFLADVTWGWPHTLAGLTLALAPLLLLLPPSVLIGGEKSAAAPTIGAAAVTVAVTLVLDGWYLCAAWLFSLRISRAGLHAWGFRRPSLHIVWAVPVALAAVYGFGVVYNLFFDPKGQDILDSFPRTLSGIALFTVLACVIAPFFEETFFRGFLFQGLSRSWGLITGATVSAGIFSLTHQQLDIFLPLFVMGLALAWVFFITRSIWGSITLHVVYNGIAVLVWAVSG